MLFQRGRRDRDDASRLLESQFGKLELSVLEALWRRDGPAAVRDLQPEFPDAAYTTLMTTLDRLFRKGIVAREKSGRAFLYHPRLDRDALQSSLAAATLNRLISTDRRAMRPILSCFVDAVGRRDRRLLDDLARLVRARQQRKPTDP